MTLNVRDRHALRAIEARLVRADPRLAAKLGMFARLTAGEEMPMRERVRPGRRRATRHQPGGRPDVLRDLACRPVRRLGLQRAILLLWLITALAMTATGLALSHAGGGRTCGPPWTACSSQPHAAGPGPAVPRSTGRQVSRVSSITP